MHSNNISPNTLIGNIYKNKENTTHFEINLTV